MSDYKDHIASYTDVHYLDSVYPILGNWNHGFINSKYATHVEILLKVRWRYVYNKTRYLHGFQYK